MKLFYLSLFACACSFHSSAQTDTTAAASDSIANKSTLTLGTVWTSNADYYGQKAMETTPYGALAATYKLKCGLYFTGLAYRLLKDTANTVSAASAGAGFEFKLSKRWTADIGYSHTFYPSNSPMLQASNPDNANASLVYDNWLSSKINLDYAFGNTTDMFITLGTGKQITLGHISKKDIITITPSIDAVAGTQHFYQEYTTQKRLRDSLADIILGPLAPPAQQTTTSTTSTEINILSYNFKCPLAYNRANYVVQLAYQLSVLSNKAQSNAGKANSFVSASFYYQF